MKKVSNVWMFVVSVVLLIFGIIMVVLTNMGNESYNSSYNANNVMIGDLQAELSSLESDMKDADDVTVVQAKLKSCAEVGKRVAELQTNYQDMSAADDEDAFMSNVNALDACFDEFDKNARVPWYSVSNAGDLHWTWKFQSTYEFGGKKVNVVWLCYADGTEDLLAYTTAVYDTETELFSKVVYNMTTLGAEYTYKPTAGIGDPEQDNTNPTDPTVGGNETVPNETETEPTEAPIPTDENGEPIFTAPDDIGGGGVPAGGPQS